MKSLFKIIESTTPDLKTYSHTQHTASHQLKTTKISHFDQSNCLTIYTTRENTGKISQKPWSSWPPNS